MSLSEVNQLLVVGAHQMNLPGHTTHQGPGKLEISMNVNLHRHKLVGSVWVQARQHLQAYFDTMLHDVPGFEGGCTMTSIKFLHQHTDYNAAPLVAGEGRDEIDVLYKEKGGVVHVDAVHDHMISAVVSLTTCEVTGVLKQWERKVAPPEATMNEKGTATDQLKAYMKQTLEDTLVNRMEETKAAIEPAESFMEYKGKPSLHPYMARPGEVVFLHSPQPHATPRTRASRELGRNILFVQLVPQAPSKAPPPYRENFQYHPVYIHQQLWPSSDRFDRRFQKLYDFDPNLVYFPDEPDEPEETEKTEETEETEETEKTK